MLPDQPAVDKEFDYVVPAGVAVQVGDVVRIPLHGRHVGGWVTAVDVESDPALILRMVRKVSGRGPSADILDLAGWAAWRWAGRRAQLLRTAAPGAVVRDLPAPAPHAPATPTGSDWLEKSLDLPCGVLRLAPGADRYAVVRAAVGRPSPVAGGRTLVLCPSVGEAVRLGERLRRGGVAVAVLAGSGAPAAEDAHAWAAAAAGSVVVGARAAAWAPVGPLGRVVVLDEHDERYQQEQAPTWHARDVVMERARRAGAPCLLVSPTPTLEALTWGELVTTDRSTERRGWPPVVVIDQRDGDPQLGPLFSEDLVRALHGPGRVVCVLNRTGRVRLLACGSCRSIARCDVCDAAVVIDELPEGVSALTCPRCSTQRPTVCLVCGGARFANLRLGVSRAREELAALVREPVGEVTAQSGPVGEERVLIGTEAVLHRSTGADVVAFLDMDQHLLAPRYRSGEEALALLALAARLVARGGGGAGRSRSGGRGRVLVQTRHPDHPSLQSAVRADPSLLAEADAAVRAAVGLPPFRALAVVSGAGAPSFIDELHALVAADGAPGLEIIGPVEGRWRLRAPDHRALCDPLAAVRRPAARMRIEVDPLHA